MTVVQEQKTATMSTGWTTVVHDTTKQGTANQGTAATITFLDESAREQYVKQTTTRFIMENKQLFDELARE
jgi:hypothetical protein